MRKRKTVMITALLFLVILLSCDVYANDSGYDNSYDAKIEDAIAELQTEIPVTGSGITKDNVTMQIDSVVYLKITDPKLCTYGVVDPMAALENLTATTLRNLVGGMKLDEALTSRDSINAKMCTVLDEATDPWGIKVIRVEVKNIIPPQEIRTAMEKEMKAEREKRATILTAEATKQEAILTAEGNKQAMVLNAEAERDAKIARADGEAKAMLAVYTAQAEGIRLINEAKPNKEYLTMKSFETLEKVADGQATKLIVPSNIQDLAATLASAAAVVKGE